MAYDRRCMLCKVPVKDGTAYCRRHLQEVESQKSQARARARKRPSYLPQYWRILHWKGNWVGLVDDGGKIEPQFITYGKLSHAPQSKVVDLDYWIEGYDKGQIKRLKRAMTSVMPFRPSDLKVKDVEVDKEGGE